MLICLFPLLYYSLFFRVKILFTVESSVDSTEPDISRIHRDESKARRKEGKKEERKEGKKELHWPRTREESSCGNL